MSSPHKARLLFPVLLAAGMLAAGASGALAQGWSAQLVLSPMATPFLSDWEVDPSQGELLVTNGTAAAANVTFHYTVARGNQVVLRGKTDPQTIGANQTAVFNARSTFGGRADWSRDLQDIVARTGRLPEGEYQACVTLAGAGGAVLVERECAQFSIGYGDAPFLVFPMNGDTVTSQAPIFEWQPVQLSPTADTRVGYVLQLAEVRTAARQRPEAALESNILHYMEPGLSATTHQYPVGALPLVSGRTYAWRVQALDGTGRPIASNQGRSEIWTFVYREPESESQRTIARVEITASRDTLRFSGDTARYEAKAYDADNVELQGRHVRWSSLDSTVARVDSTGVVRGANTGETRIVASIEGVTDSARSVTASPTNLTVRFEAYDAATDKPGLLELVRSGSFEEVGPKLMAMLQAGEFRIPLPRLPGVEAALGSSSGPGGAGAFDGSSGIEGSRARGGPSAMAVAYPGSTSALRARACNDVAFNVRDPYMSLDEKVFVFYIPLNKAQRQEVTNCLGVPNDEGEVTEVERLRGAIFIVSWKHPGIPRVILAVKGPGLGLTLAGPKVDVRYLVLNLTPSIEVGSDLLPANFGGYFGDVTFDAGTGLTYYSRRRCTDAVTQLCRFLSWINPENPFITISAFAGVNASEVSVGSGGKGASMALGFTLSATLPVRVWNVKGLLGGSLDSTQVGLSFAAQDSLVAGAGGEEGAHHKSVNVAPMVKVWFTGSGGNSWEVEGSVAFEVDPDKPSDPVKLVIAAEVPARWKFLVARLGNPTVIFTKMLEAEGDVELGLSGTWGVGAWDGNPAEAVGIDPVDGNDVRFEELGRGAVILEWAKPAPALTPAQARSKQRQDSWDNARRSASVQAAILKRNCEIATIEAEQAKVVRDRDITAHGLYVEKDSKRASMCHQAELEKTRQVAIETQIAEEKKAAELAEKEGVVQQGPAGPPTCDGTLVFSGTRCFSWSTRFSLASTSIVDLVALVIRLATGGTPLGGTQ